MGTTLSGNGSFDGAIKMLAGYLGNAILPICAGLILCMAIWAYSQRKSGDQYVVGAMVALLASGLIRVAETFAAQGTGAGQYLSAVLTLVNYVSNVIMPVFAALELVRGILELSGFMERMTIGDDASRHFILAGMCLSVSGMVRLLEFFVMNATGGVS